MFLYGATCSLRKLFVHLPCKLVVVLLCLLGPMTAQKVSVDYDKAADFTKLKTYAWTKGTPAANPNMDMHIKASVDSMLQQKGMRKVEQSDEADILLTYHAASNADLFLGGPSDPTFSATGGVPIPGQTVWSPAPGMSPTSNLVQKGSIVFQMYDRSTQHLIWTSRAQGTLDDRRTEKLQQVNKTLNKIFDRFPPHK